MRATGFSYWAGIARDTLCLANEAADVAARTFNCFNKAQLAKQLSRSVALVISPSRSRRKHDHSEHLCQGVAARGHVWVSLIRGLETERVSRADLGHVVSSLRTSKDSVPRSVSRTTRRKRFARPGSQRPAVQLLRIVRQVPSIA